MLIKSMPKGLKNTKLISYDDFHKKMSINGHVVQIRCKEIYEKLGTHPIFVDFAESNQALCKQLRSYYDGTYYPPLEHKDTYIKKRINSLIKEDPITYEGPIDRDENNLLEYLSNLLLYKALLLDIMEQLNGDLDTFKDLKQNCEFLDYKLSIHLRFTRSMCALNAYTEANFTPEILRMHYTPYHETGAQDMFCRMIIKRVNLMKLARGAINRYVTCRPGVISTINDRETRDSIYTTPLFRLDRFMTYDPELSKYRSSPGPVSDKSYDGKPIWFSLNATTNSLSDRIQQSCKEFNHQIVKSVISTYGNYYKINNVLHIKEDGRLYLNYKNDSNTLKIPLEELKPDEAREARLHVPIISGNMPTTIGGNAYEEIKFPSNRGVRDIYGLLYGIRKGSIAVSLPESRFHSCIWSGKAVQATGILCAWNGKIIAVDNMSGHYKPNWYLLYRAWEPFYQKGIFHDDAMIGIIVKKPGSFDNQFLKAKAFMKLAKRSFPIGETLQELERHEQEMKKVTEQKDKEDCENVVKSYPMSDYPGIWDDKNSRDDLAANFIEMMYDCVKIDKLMKDSQDQQYINNLIKNRSKLVKKLIRKRPWLPFKKGWLYSYILEKRYKSSLQKAVKNYLVMGGTIGTKILTIIKEHLPEIESANNAYSDFTKTLPRFDETLNQIDMIEKSFGSWIKKIRSVVNVEANKKAGFDEKNPIFQDSAKFDEKNPIFLDSREQKAKAEEYIKDRSIFPASWGAISIDNLSNSTSSGEEGTIVMNKLRLVDSSIFKKPPLKKTQPKTTTQKKSHSTTAKEGVFLYCRSCERYFDPTKPRPPGEPKLAVGSNCPNCKGYHPLTERRMKDQGK